MLLGVAVKKEDAFIPERAQTWNLETRIQVLALPLSSFVTLEKHNLFELLLSHL